MKPGIASTNSANLRLIRLLLLLTMSFGVAHASPANWSGKYSPCDRHPDLLSRGYVDLGVRLSTSNEALARQFERAMEFWSSVIDIDWHEVESQSCSIQLVDGAKDLFDSASVAARSQIPDLPEFEGWIAFNPASKLTEQEMFMISVHEIGHLLGLTHNPDSSSVMFFLDLDDAASLDAADLSALAERHKLRPGILASGHVTAIPVPMP